MKGTKQRGAGRAAHRTAPDADRAAARFPSLNRGAVERRHCSRHPSEGAATERFLEFQDSWGTKYLANVKPWSDAWAEFVPFLSFDVEIRKVLCSTNAIESLDARIRRAVRARGHFLNEAAALTCVYMALMSLDPTGKGRKRRTRRWKAPLNAFQIAFEGRLTLSNN
ncbi:transposase-like protein [Streptomyces rishiriensis]|uniref:Mutator family transposase n=1 Tax=Streptomyces rishiriensis TaxID=68264 RepID=A0ABU0NIR4_STRRH|nr:transposase-like protein [Streptomyces rishiriensis]